MAAYYGRQHLDDFAAYALAHLANIAGHEIIDDTVFADLYQDEVIRRCLTGSRHAPPAEAIIETVRRERDLCGLRQTMQNTRTAGILCGSVCYGPYFNVHGGKSPSDLDLVIVPTAGSSAASLISGLRKASCFTKNDVDDFTARALLYDNTHATTSVSFSYKIPVWSHGDPWFDHESISGYHLSLHVFPEEVWEYLLAESSPRISRFGPGQRRTISDYRNTQTDRQDILHSFHGGSVRGDTVSLATELGFLRHTNAYIIDDDRFHQGVFQSMIQLRKVLWGDELVEVSLERFDQRIRNSIRDEHHRFPHAELKASHAHERENDLPRRALNHLNDTYSLE